MLARFKLMTRKSEGFFHDLALGWQMLKRGKLKLRAPRMQGRREVRDIFTATEARQLKAAESGTGT